MTKKLISFFLALALLTALFASLSVGVGAAATKEEKHRTIAIVYDNSGSMFLEDGWQGGHYDPMAWCRATYAVEVFAAMMNPGDKLMIYPMGPMNNGTVTDTKPLVIKGGGDLSPIRNIQTDHDNETPVETVDRAAQGLADDPDKAEKWLIILTDGDVFYESGKKYEDQGKKTHEELGKKIQGILDKNLNVIYLGIGANLKEPSATPSGKTQYYSGKAKDGTEVTAKLSEMCNKIFGRDELPSNFVNVSSGTVNFDVSMKKLIVFVQGEGIGNVEVKDPSSGAPVGSSNPPFSTRYNDKGVANNDPDAYKLENWKIDKSLQGELVTYENCKAGDYALTYSGTPSSVSIYYEPDVDFVARLYRKGETGLIEVTDPEGLIAGEYVVSTVMLDADGRETTSELLGSIEYKTTYTINGEPHTAEGKDVSFTLNAGDEFGDAEFEVTYLSGYKIHKKGSEFGWPFDIPVLPVPRELTVTCVSVVPESFGLSEFPGDTVFSFVYSCDGQPIEGADLGTLTPQFSVDGLSVNFVKTDKGFDVTLGHLGEMAATECREYTLTASGSYTDSLNGKYQVLNPAVVIFSLVNDGYEIGLDLEAPQTYFETYKFDDGEPLIVHLTKDGAPLSADDLLSFGSVLTVDTDGIDYDLTPDPDNSAFILKLKSSDSLKKGSHVIKATVSTTNNIGVPVTAEDSVRISVQPYPQWVPWVIAGSIIAVLAALIAFIMTRKVLPKKIMFDPDLPAEVLVGARVIDEPDIRLSGNGNRGQLVISMQAVNYQATDGVTMNIIAESPRYVKSSRRKVKFVSGSFMTPNARSLLAGDQFRLDPNSGTTVVNMEGESAFETSLANGDYINMTTRINNRSFTIRGTLLFK